MPAPYSDSPVGGGESTRASLGPTPCAATPLSAADTRNATPEKRNASEVTKSVSSHAAVYSILPCGLTHDDEAPRNCSYSSNNTDDGSVGASTGGSQLNGLSKSCERGLNFHIQDTRFLEAQSTEVARHHHTSGVSSNCLLRSDAASGHASTSVEKDHVDVTGASRPLFQLSSKPSGSVRSLPNPHVSPPVPVVCVPALPLQWHSCGTGHLAEFKGEVDHHSAATDRCGRGRTSPLDPPEAEDWTRGDGDAAAPPRATAARLFSSEHCAERVGAATSELATMKMSDEKGPAAVSPAARTEVADIYLSGVTEPPTSTEDAAAARQRASVRVLTVTAVPFEMEAAKSALTAAMAMAAEEESKDHLSPVRTTACLVRKHSGAFWSCTGAAVTGRRSSFSSVPTAALAPPSSIPPMDVAPQNVVDHFHDAYRATSPVRMNESTSASYPPSTAGAHTGASNEHAMPEPAAGSVLHDDDDGAVDQQSDEDVDEDGPPLLSMTRRQSFSEEEEEEGREAADPAAAFAPLAVTPPENVGDAAMVTPPRGAHVAASLPESPERAASALTGFRSPPETAVTVMFQRGALRGPEGDNARATAALAQARDAPLSWFAEAGETAEAQGREQEGEEGKEGDSGATATAPVATVNGPLTRSFSSNSPPEASSLGGEGASLPNSPPLATAPLAVTPPERGAFGKPNSLPRRPPRALFSCLTSPQQLSLLETPTTTTTATATTATTKMRVGGALTSVALANAAATREAVGAAPTGSSDTAAHTAAAASVVPASGAGVVEGEAGSGECRTASPPPSSLPTSPEEMDLAQLVHQHVSQRIAQNYAQSCSYYLHYHSQPGSITGGPPGRGSYSYPNSPEDYMWDDEDLKEVEAEAEQPTPAAGAKAAAASGATVDVTAQRTSQSTASRVDPYQQQPQRRRFSCAVPRKAPM